MITIQDLGFKLVPVVDAALTAHKREKQLVPLQHTVYNSQMAIYWFREAVKDLKNLEVEGGIQVSEPTSEEIVVNTSLPTMFGLQEHLNYMTTQLTTIIKETDELIKTAYFPEHILYKVQRGYDKIHEGLFNTELAINYYEQLTGRK